MKKSASPSRDRKDTKSSTRIEPEKHIATRASVPFFTTEQMLGIAARALAKGIRKPKRKYEK